MALTSIGWELAVTLVDNQGNTSTSRYTLFNGATALPPADYTEASAAASALIADLDAVTLAVIKSYSIYERFVEDALTLPGQGVEVEDRAAITVQIEDNPLKRSMLYVPSPIAAMFQATSGPSALDVDVSNTALQNFVANFNNGGAANATISDGELVDAGAANSGIVKGVRTKRRSARG